MHISLTKCNIKDRLDCETSTLVIEYANIVQVDDGVYEVVPMTNQERDAIDAMIPFQNLLRNVLK